MLVFTRDCMARIIQGLARRRVSGHAAVQCTHAGGRHVVGGRSVGHSARNFARLACLRLPENLSLRVHGLSCRGRRSRTRAQVHPQTLAAVGALTRTCGREPAAAASLLLASNQSSTIARSPADYVDLAALFLRPASRRTPGVARVRRGMQELRYGSDVFDNRLFARRLERALLLALDCRLLAPWGEGSVRSKVPHFVVHDPGRNF